MTTINISKPGDIDIELNYPTKWDELLFDEILQIAKSLISNGTSEEIRAAILLFIIESRAKAAGKKLPKKWKDLVDPESFFIEGNSLLDFIFKENTLTIPPENVIKLSGLVPYSVYAPEKGFSSLTCGEVEDAEVFYYKFLEGQKTEDLAHLAAILWRHNKARYQVRKNDRLETYPADRWVKLFMKLEPHRLYSIFIWFTGCKNLMPKIFPVMHTPDENSSQEPDKLSFTKCIHAGAGPKNGTRDQIRVMSFMEFMFDMEQEAVKAKELKDSTE